MPDRKPVAAIVDYGLGNLYSVVHACGFAGLEAEITSSGLHILNADAVILPGVGAFGTAMDTLRRLDLVGVLRDVAHSGKPLIGICLGLQLLMSESSEFGCHQGLEIVKGMVSRFDGPKENGRLLKVPHVGWNRVCSSYDGLPWSGTLFDGIESGAYMYFVHSFIAHPEDPGLVLGQTRYGSIEFCSAIQQGNVCGFQFHPERSGTCGIRMYQNLAMKLNERMKGVVH